MGNVGCVSVTPEGRPVTAPSLSRTMFLPPAVALTLNVSVRSSAWVGVYGVYLMGTAAVLPLRMTPSPSPRLKLDTISLAGGSRVTNGGAAEPYTDRMAVVNRSRFTSWTVAGLL